MQREAYCDLRGRNLLPLEKLHLSLLKWTIGVNKYTSNAAVGCMRHSFNYEQKALQVSWYTAIDNAKPALEADQLHPPRRPNTHCHEELVLEQMKCDQVSNSKLGLYNEIKNDIYDEK